MDSLDCRHFICLDDYPDYYRQLSTMDLVQAMCQVKPDQVCRNDLDVLRFPLLFFLRQKGEIIANLSRIEIVIHTLLKIFP